MPRSGADVGLVRVSRAAASSPPPAHSAPRRALALLAAAGAGAGSAVQSRINGELGARLHDGIAAATVSFATGLVLLLILVIGSRPTRRALRRLPATLRERRLRPWQCLGGVCGAFLVCTQGLTVASLGVAVFTVAVVAGQSASSLVVDRFGLGPGGRHDVSVSRAMGAGLAVIAVAVAVGPQLDNPTRLGLILLPMLAGVGIAWQQAVNGQVRAATSVWAATVVNFVVGTTALGVALAVELAVRGRPAALPHEPWLYLGGALGVAFIATAAAVVGWTGVLLLGLGMVTGQLLGALGIDLVAPSGGNRPSAAILAGIGLTLAAVAVASLPRRRQRPEPS